MAEPRSRWGSIYDVFLKKQPRQSRSRALVEVVLTATRDMLSRSDDDVTVQAVAERAGVGIGSLYDYFSDRDSLFAGVAAKLTEDNLVQLREALVSVRERPLEEAIAASAAHVFDTYLRDRRMNRAVIRIAHRMDLMPVLAKSQTTYARALAEELRARSDVKLRDPELTAYVMTNMTMGLVTVLLWRDDEEITEAAARRELERVWIAALTAGSDA